ncbi:MAG: acylphosphatase [Candidatus Dadabacteria bacterium]|nr:acylphosphatase [Candidatus Dadabacteria bacterium]NIQ14084.1 acylphosphatase [Candidatus Dadabacteria bacterium]
MVEKRVCIEVKGKVQGVFFRASTVDVATNLGLKGWVKNLPNGNVRIIAEGEEVNLRKLCNWCRKGPSRAVVNSIDVEWKSPKSDFNSFSILK